MASPARDTIVTLLRENPPVQGSTVLEMRTSLDELTGKVPPPEGTRIESVDADGVAAEWITAPGADESRALLYFHGGGYCMGNVQGHRVLCSDLSSRAGCRVLSVDYRLAPEHPFPAAVEDAVRAYRFLVGSGTPPERIAIAGDSAGGGLTAAALVALRDNGDALPAAGVLISPWLDLALAGDSMYTCAERDPMAQRESLALMAKAYLDGENALHPHASPLYADLSGLPRLLIHVGTDEVLLDDSTRFAERAEAAGVRTILEVWEDMFHVWHAFVTALPEAQRANDRIGEYLREAWES